eukprot:CAMPEP_0118992998 /NCGR_PEP_ID=MMETSP1173-20130426/54253_1 /TAXON_ID=1034831 /ORGANISM="Rhizochromulina marina cf, Strain CCMP1243" /LENGTH=90 /DNA_ID=CAMNT_0006944221 /DNA_START=14 /DNA_END=282 /DNA_ORIENTATION=+
MEYAARLGKLKLGEEDVAKVTPDRAYGVAVHPSATSVIAAVGDRDGNLGVWNADAPEGSPNDGVMTFTPHTKVVNVLSFNPHNPALLYST